MLGMIIGVGAVIALMSIGQGVQASVTSQIKGLGSNLLFVTPGATTSGGVRAQAGSAPTLTSEDAEAIVDSGRVPAGGRRGPRGGQLRAGGGQRPEHLHPPQRGDPGLPRRCATSRSPRGSSSPPSRSPPAPWWPSWGATARQNLFADSDALGQTVRVNNVNLRVVGVMEAKGAQAQGNQDDVIYVPLSTMQTRLNRNRTARGGQTVSTDQRAAGGRPRTRPASPPCRASASCCASATARPRTTSPSAARKTCCRRRTRSPASSPSSWAPWPGSPSWWAGSGS